MRQMDADLVGPAGFEPALDQSGQGFGWGTIDLPDLVMRHRVPPPGGSHGHLQRIGRIAAKVGVDGALRPRRRAPDEGEIAPVEVTGPPVIGELRREMLMRGIGLGGDEQAGRLLVEPVHDAGADHTADTGQARRAVMEQCVDERARRHAGAGMHDHPGRLVDDDQIVILMDDIERNGLGRGPCRFRRRYDQHDPVAFVDPVIGVQYVPTGDGHRACPDQALDAGAAQPVAAVEPDAGGACGDLDRVGSGGRLVFGRFGSGHDNAWRCDRRQCRTTGG